MTHSTRSSLIALALFCAAAAATPVCAGQSDEPGSCYLAQQLASNELERAEYQARLNQIRAAGRSRFGERVLYSVTINLRGEQVSIDTVSLDCITCHDGMNTPTHELRAKNASGTSSGIDSLKGGHPIGMHYGSAAYTNRELRGIHELDEELVLVDGKVGCLSCHNLFNPKKKHLAKETVRSELCFSCHAK